MTLIIELLAAKEQATKQETIDEIKRWYDGYSWDGSNFVYNPFSTLLLFAARVFKDHWFATGSPTFLVDLIKERGDVKLFLEPIILPAAHFDSFDIQAIDPQVLLFQTGYLTVKKIEKSQFSSTMLYTLGVPNEEVKQALTIHLLASYVAAPLSAVSSMQEQMMQQLLDGDPQSFERNLQAMFARIPNQVVGEK
ncbi:hypothetical protein AGMMS49525_12840 [Bacteroidia bacterium]|nr:hypothetical protein AGMMS49525_12840 [Bacteroidia bacterium]